MTMLNDSEKLNKLNKQQLEDKHKEELAIARQTYKNTKELKTLIMKEQKLFHSKQKLAEFEEPVLLMLRRTGTIDIKEGVKGDKYQFTHSNGSEAEIILTPLKQHKFPYAGKDFRCYVCFEDEALPLPQDPLLETETFKITIDKLTHDMKKWKADTEVAIGKKWFKILAGAALVLLVVFGLPMIIQAVFGVDVSSYLPWTAKKAATMIAQNATNITNATGKVAVTVLT